MIQPLELSASVVVARPPEEVYAMVSDVTRMGEWSPVCKACWWDEGASPAVGAWFTGRNELDGRVWETRSQVAAAEPGEAFAFVVSPTGTRWGYTFRAVDGGTEVSESWAMPDEAVAFFRQRFGDDADHQIELRYETAKAGIPATLAAIKRAAES